MNTAAKSAEEKEQTHFKPPGKKPLQINQQKHQQRQPATASADIYYDQSSKHQAGKSSREVYLLNFSQHVDMNINDAAGAPLPISAKSEQRHSKTPPTILPKKPLKNLNTSINGDVEKFINQKYNIKNHQKPSVNVYSSKPLPLTKKPQKVDVAFKSSSSLCIDSSFSSASWLSKAAETSSTSPSRQLPPSTSSTASQLDDGNIRSKASASATKPVRKFKSSSSTTTNSTTTTTTSTEMSTTQETKTLSSSSAKPKILAPKPILSSLLTSSSASVETSQTEPSNRDDVSHHVHAAPSPFKKPRRLIRVTSNEITSNGNDDDVDSILTFNNKFKKTSPQYITNSNEKVDTNNFSYHLSNNNDDKPISNDVIMNDSNNNNNNNFNNNNKNNVNKSSLKSHNDISSANTSIHSRNDLKASKLDECGIGTSNELTSDRHVMTRVDDMVPPSTKGQSNNVDDVILLMARVNCDDRSARCGGVSVHESPGGDCNECVDDAWEGGVGGGRSRDGIDKDEGKDNHKNIDKNRNISHDKQSTKNSNEDQRTVYVVMYSYNPCKETELALSINDVIYLIYEGDDEWMLGQKKETGEEGWFRRSQVREGARQAGGTLMFEASATHSSAVHNSAASSQTISKKSSQLSLEKSLVNNDNNNPEIMDTHQPDDHDDDDDDDFDDDDDVEDADDEIGFECSVKHDYKAVYDDDISLHEGESIIVTETLENGWWRGYTRSKEGFFPGSYVQVKSGNQFCESNVEFQNIGEETYECIDEFQTEEEDQTKDKSIRKKGKLLSRHYGYKRLSQFLAKKFPQFNPSHLTSAKRDGKDDFEKTKTNKSKRFRRKESQIARTRNQAPQPPSTLSSHDLPQTNNQKKLNRMSKNILSLFSTNNQKNNSSNSSQIDPIADNTENTSISSQNLENQNFSNYLTPDNTGIYANLPLNNLSSTTTDCETTPKENKTEKVPKPRKSENNFKTRSLISLKDLSNSILSLSFDGSAHNVSKNTSVNETKMISKKRLARKPAYNMNQSVDEDKIFHSPLNHEAKLEANNAEKAEMISSPIPKPASNTEHKHGKQISQSNSSNFYINNPSIINRKSINTILETSEDQSEVSVSNKRHTINFDELKNKISKFQINERESDA